MGSFIIYTAAKNSIDLLKESRYNNLVRKYYQAAWRSVNHIPATVWALGLGSMFMDISAEMVSGLMPIFMVTTLNASMTFVGVMEGCVESLVFLSQLFAGVISDCIGRRKPVALPGFILTALAKLLYPFAQSGSLVFVGRLGDRLGKGIRNAPRDALISELSNNTNRGAVFGIRQSMDSFGAVLGPFIAIMLMWLLDDNMQGVFYFAIIPGFLSVWIIAQYVHESKITSRPRKKIRFNFQAMRRVDIRYWRLLVITALLMLGRMSDAFFLLKANSVGLSLRWMPIVLVLINIINAILAYPAGILSDFLGRKRILAIGITFMIVADSILAFSHSISTVFIGIIFWGMHIGFAQGILSALIADLVKDPSIHGTSYGLFNCICGVSILAGNILAGGLWDNFGPKATYCMSGFFATLSLISLMWIFTDDRKFFQHRE